MRVSENKESGINTKRKALGLLSRLRNNKDVVNLDVFTCNSDTDWVYYFSITGFFKNSYFAINCFHHTNKDPHFEVLEHVTEKIEQFKKQFKL